YHERGAGKRPAAGCRRKNVTGPPSGPRPKRRDRLMRARRAASLLAAVAAVLLALPLAAQPPRGPHDPAEILHNPRLLSRYLRLTPDQVTASQKLFADLKAATDPLRQQEPALSAAFEAAVSAPNANPCDVGQAALAVHANQEKIK